MKKRFRRLMPTIVETAKKHGYAIGFHGSGERDLDLMAVAWVEKVSHPAELANAITLAVEGFREGGIGSMYILPHGRLSYPIKLGGQGRDYIDLCVIDPEWRE